MSKWGISWVVALLLSGCGGPRAALQSDKQRLEAQVGQLKAQARRDRGTIRDLENQVFLLEDKLETAQLEGVRTAEPALPVEVLEPEAMAEPTAGPGYEIVGIDDEGNQIVYVGEAAKDRSVAPRMDKYRLEGDDPAPASSARLPDVPITADDDRIPVTSSVPTIDNQLRQARRAPAPASDGKAIDADQARAHYQRHYAALRAGDHAAAIAGFRAFVEQYPQHDYADNAQYWLGEAYYDQKDYKRAMREFRRVVKNHPRGNKVPDSLLKIGYCYAALNERDKARDVLQQVMRVYPASGPAKLAERRLAELDR